MKKITIALLVILTTGCAGMGTDSSATSGRSDMRAGQNSSMGNSVLNSNVQLTLHHGG